MSYIGSKPADAVLETNDIADGVGLRIKEGHDFWLFQGAQFCARHGITFLNNYYSRSLNAVVLPVEKVF